MPIDTGTRFGPYEIAGFIGAGGMGQVYRARDERLNRMVALKILPPELVADTERRRRFTQEAQLASSLQHPNIVTIFDIGSGADGSEYLAMELVSGHTLETMIPAKGMRLPDALRYGAQIADALAAAHNAGIVHRDLKPGNIMVTDQGQVKILDFGLATLAGNGPLTSSADETRVGAPPGVVETGIGMIVGTLAYMSPEQAEGKKVDARSDIFSFGAILYEMLSGQRAFSGDSAAATLAAVINKDPQPLTQQTSGVVPQPVERLVSRCLRKDLSRRAQHASDIKLAIEELQEDSTSGSMAAPASSAVTPAPTPLPARSRGRRMFGIATAVVVIAGLIGVALWPQSTPPAPAAAVTVTPLTSLPGFESSPTFSADGTQVAFQWTPEGASHPDVYLQLIGTSGTRLRLTNDDGAHGLPAWSPDGKSIALWHGGPDGLSICLVSPLGGPERRILAWNGNAGRLSWSPDGQWLAASPVGNGNRGERGVVLISTANGSQVDWAAIDNVYKGTTEPSFSPDGRRMAYTRTIGDNTGELFVTSVGADGKPTGTPTALPFSGRELRNPIWTHDGSEILVVSGSPTSNGGIARVRVDGQGGQMIPGLNGAATFALSRDGHQLTFSRGGTNNDIWRIDVREPQKSQSIAPSTLWDGGAEYSPDGKRIAFASNRAGAREIWVADASGENAQPLTSFGGPIAGTARWSPDGTQLVFDGRPDRNSDIFTVPAGGGAVRQLTKTPGEDARPAWSADGKSIYFSSDRSGRNEIWRIAPDGSSPVQVTKDGGVAAVTSPDGTWIFYKRPNPVEPLYAIHSDGTGDGVVVTDSVPFMSFTATKDALWFLAAPTEGRNYWSLRVRHDADGRISEAVKLDFPQDNLNISVSPDERYVLVSRRDTSGTDLMLVSDFR